MKNTTSLLALAATLTCTSVVYGQSASSGASNTSQNATATDPTSLTSANGLGSAALDKKFLHKAAEGGLTEIQLGQLASQKATRDDVKQFGQKMVTDHTQLNADLKPFADQMGVTAPTSLDAKDQALYDRLNGLSGPAFDKAYLMAMVKDHKQDTREFTAETKTTKDPQLKAAVQKGLTVVQKHTTMVEQLAKGSSSQSTGQ